MRRLLPALLAIATLAAPPLAAAPCPEGRRLAGDPGVARYRCVGGACQIWARDAEGLAHLFTTEPRIDRLVPGSPAAERLRPRDVLVAVDGRLITTAEAGRRLANLRPGEAVRLWIRRDGRDLEVELTAVAGCGPSGLTVRAGDEP